MLNTKRKVKVMGLKIAICDDDILDLENEFNLIDSIFTDKQIEHEIKTFNISQELLDSDDLYDMAFLDIEMDGINGIETAKQILERNKDCFIFFITNYSIYLDNAFDVKAFRYLSKPVDKTRLCAGIDSAVEKIRDNTLMLSVTNYKNKLVVDVEISSVIYIENSNRHTHIVTTEYDFIAEEPFVGVKSNIEKEVNYFAETHQSFFVNMRYVTHYDRTDVVLSYAGREYKVDMSRRKYNAFDEKIFRMAKVLK